MSDWRVQFQEKEVSAKKAIEKIVPGQKIFIDSGCCEPQALVHELSRQSELKDIEIFHFLSLRGAIAPSFPRKESQNLLIFKKILAISFSLAGPPFLEPVPK